MEKVKIFSVSDRYIAYLRQDARLKIVFDNKENVRSHTRKYLGVVFRHDEYNYFIPFSSPKSSDYILQPDGSNQIRKSIVPIVRMITTDTASGKVELKGTLKLSNMIPVPDSELTPYSINDEKDLNYRMIVEKEYDFIKSNISTILKYAQVIYNQKTKAATLYATQPAPNYIKNTVDFQYAEVRCRAFLAEQLKANKQSPENADTPIQKESLIEQLHRPNNAQQRRPQQPAEKESVLARLKQPTTPSTHTPKPKKRSKDFER